LRDRGDETPLRRCCWRRSTSSTKMALKEEQTEEVKLVHSFSALPNSRTAADDEIWNASWPYRDGQTFGQVSITVCQDGAGARRPNDRYKKKRKHQPHDTITFRRRQLFSERPCHRAQNGRMQPHSPSKRVGSIASFILALAPWPSPRKLPTLRVSAALRAATGPPRRKTHRQTAR